MVLLQRKLYFPKDPEGVQHFSFDLNLPPAILGISHRQSDREKL